MADTWGGSSYSPSGASTRTEEAGGYLVVLLQLALRRYVTGIVLFVDDRRWGMLKGA